MGTLKQIISITQALLEANKSNDQGSVSRLDSQLEHVVGEKERAFGALHQHRQDHGC